VGLCGELVNAAQAISLRLAVFFREIELFKVTDEWARRFQVMEYLRAVNVPPPTKSCVEGGSGYHTERRRGKVNP
jgi:hypothetical protein